MLSRLQSWRWWRRTSQVVFVLLLFWSFTELGSGGGNPIERWASFFFLIDPLVGASAMLAMRIWISAFWPALVLLALTLLLGRFFCGWICPLGTLIDWIGAPLRKLLAPIHRRLCGFLRPLLPIRFFVLVAVLIGASLGFSIVGYFDPLAILVRGLVAGAWPFFDSGLQTSSSWSSQHAPAWFNLWVNDPLYRLFDATLEKPVFQAGVLSLVILLVVLALEIFARRFWCRYLCPLGAMLSLPGRFSLLKRTPGVVCGKCAAGENCGQTCRMGAFDASGRLSGEKCNLCLDCLDQCPREGVSFHFRLKGPANPGEFDFSRRQLLSSLAVGAAVPALAHAARIGHTRKLEPDLLRPPGVHDEQAFLNQCIRCGQCLKACPTNALQPAVLQAGIEGMFSPVFSMRIGYCEYNCTRCGQVCPSGAIPRLQPAVKHNTLIGKAEFDRSLCLPWAKNEPCIVCEEHCPVPDKAIRLTEVNVIGPDGQPTTLQRPRVMRGLCIGCGICENKCPIAGPAAIRVSRLQSAPVTSTPRPPVHGHGPNR